MSSAVGADTASRCPVFASQRRNDLPLSTREAPSRAYTAEYTKYSSDRKVCRIFVVARSQTSSPSPDIVITRAASRMKLINETVPSFRMVRSSCPVATLHSLSTPSASPVKTSRAVRPERQQVDGFFVEKSAQLPTAREVPQPGLLVDAGGGNRKASVRRNGDAVDGRECLVSLEGPQLPTARRIPKRDLSAGLVIYAAAAGEHARAVRGERNPQRIGLKRSQHPSGRDVPQLHLRRVFPVRGRGRQCTRSVRR